ncbi:Aquaporin-4 [Desmophyllum pertusum]|uniref:Aquaporin-4 n=1 Tax=Desmophyllum pertusum TaxID=174260 RepID=A0A9X0DBB2_9CNID|nr:Aquaporin-4 [Desmophyllum pertusum]
MVTIFISSVVESVCSMLFVLIGCGSTISWPQDETSPNTLSVSLCFGFSYAFLVNISTCFSGGFFNPAVTIALAANKSLSVKRALCYVLAQLIGAIIGAGLLYIIVPYESRGLLGVTQIQPVSTLVGFGVELLMTLAVTLTVLMCADGGHTTYPVTGCGINPARVFGPAVIAHKWTDHWVYWLGPIIGALLATAIYHVANNFPVTTADELVITGRELKGKAQPDKKEANQEQPQRKYNTQTQTPYELKTTV